LEKVAGLGPVRIVPSLEALIQQSKNREVFYWLKHMRRYEKELKKQRCVQTEIPVARMHVVHIRTFCVEQSTV
jgi:hypothetical protein